MGQIILHDSNTLLSSQQHQLVLISLLILLMNLISCQPKGETYVCPPCKLTCDQLTFSEPGYCPECEMKLIALSKLTSGTKPLKDVAFEEATGKFSLLSANDTSKRIIVHYYLSNQFSDSSSVIIVLPGAGRNGGDYRDAWIELAKKYSLLVLSLEYPEYDYPGFWSYNMGGMIKDVNIETKNFSINKDSTKWIFNDFDQVFEATKNKLGFYQTQYDLFGHSAGGQVLHRLALFGSSIKVGNIIAANSGWYTIPTDSIPFPYGLKGLSSKSINVGFDKSLTILLGELDNANEKRGHLRRTPEVDVQGIHRLDRGKYFYSTSENIARTLNKKFNWKLLIAPNIGHDYKSISLEAADYLYSNNNLK